MVCVEVVMMLKFQLSHFPRLLQQVYESVSWYKSEPLLSDAFLHTMRDLGYDVKTYAGEPFGQFWISEEQAVLFLLKWS